MGVLNTYLEIYMSKLITPKNKLKEKVGNGGFNQADIEKAQTSIEENDVDFVPIAGNYLKLIRKALEKYEQSGGKGDLYSDLLDQLTQLRAQGSMFHYPSITEITDTVVDLLDSLATIDDTIIEIVVAYEKSANIILSSEIKSKTDPICVALVKELKAVCDRYKTKKT